MAGNKVVLPDETGGITVYDSPYSQLLGLEEFFIEHPLKFTSDLNLYVTGCIGPVDGSLREFSSIYD